MTDQPPDDEAAARRQRIEAMFADSPIAPPKIVPGGYPVAMLDAVEAGDEAAVDQLGDFLRRGVVELMRRGRGSIYATAYIFCRSCPMGGATVDPLYTTSITAPEAHDNHFVKNALTTLVHGVAMLGHARAVTFVMEAWRVTVEPGQTAPTGSLEFVPERKEIVSVTLETASIRRVWHGAVTRYGHRGFMIAPFEKAPTDIQYKGRFFGLMQPGYDPNEAGRRS